MMTARQKALLFWTVLGILLVLVIWLRFLPELQKGNFSLSPNDGMQKVFARVAIEKQAKIAVKAGHYEEALRFYRKAANPSLVSAEYQLATAEGGIRKVLRLQGNYRQALDALIASAFSKGEASEAAMLKKQELEALIDFQATRSPKKIIKHIEQIRSDYADFLPPQNYSTAGSDIYISNILQLYDAIEDYDGGIAYIDMCLNYFKSAVEARGEEFVLGGFHNEFLAIRQAFEESKAGMPKICGDGGKTCIGRATHAIIQSDYFPW